MTDLSSLNFATASQLAAAIRDKKVSAVEVLEAHLAQIARHNPALNVIVTLDEAGARQRAREADAALARGELWGPLHGVPMTIKDAFATKGLRTTSGYPGWADFVPQVDAPLVARLRSAGAVLLGKTNLPAFSADVQTDNPVFGRTNNPWNLARTPGGSTGGAAAVAAGMTPLELGSDLAGSIRIPAHFCGVFGLKTTDYRLPDAAYHPNPAPEPFMTGGPAELGVYGPLTRSVEDLVLAFQILAAPRPDPVQWMRPPVPVGPLPDLRLEHLRLAWTTEIGGAPIDRDTQAALTGLAQKLEPAVAQFGSLLLHDFDFVQAWTLWGQLVPATMSFDADMVELLGGHPQAGSHAYRAMARGVHFTLAEYLESLRQRSQLITALERFFMECDALILPVTSTPAFPHCPTLTPIPVDGVSVDYVVATTACTCPFNLTGHPVVTIPVAKSAEGLPIGVQIVGPRWSEMRLLAIAGQIAEAAGPFEQPPGY